MRECRQPREQNLGRHPARSRQRGRQWSARPFVLLLGCGLLVGALLGLSLRDIIHESYANGRIGALLGTASPPVAEPKQSASAEASNYEIGYSYASALRIEEAERCKSLPPALVAGCTAYARAPRAEPEQAWP